MAVSQDVALQIEQDLLARTEVIVHYLRGLEASDAPLAERIRAAVIARLEGNGRDAGDLSLSAKPDRSSAGPRRQPVLVASRTGADEIEEFVLESLTDSPLGLSVQEIVDRLAEAELDIKRQTLVVRLHRMVQAGKLTSRAHGHYILSEAEHGRRRAP
jgi:hypothetical protein